MGYYEAGTAGHNAPMLRYFPQPRHAVVSFYRAGNCKLGRLMPYERIWHRRAHSAWQNPYSGGRNSYRFYSDGWCSIGLFKGGEPDHGVHGIATHAAAPKPTDHPRYRD